MRLLSNKAGQLLLEKAKSIRENHDSWRCIYINFSEHAEPYNEGLRTNIVTNILKDLLELDDGYIYLYPDDDIVLLFKGSVSAILEHFGEDFKSLGSEAGNMEPSRGFYTVFDLSKHWSAFITLCEKKADFHPAVPRVSLPLAMKEVQEIYKADVEIFHAMASAREARQRPLILLVEDDPFTRKLIRVTLKEQVDIVEAADGNSAIKAYESSAPDAVFLDLDLPDINGHVVLSKLLALDKAAFIVMLSAHSIKENILAALEKGAQGFITKPFTKEKLLHYLRLTKLGQQYFKHSKERSI